MALVALTEIVHGAIVDGENVVTVLKEGEAVGKKLEQDVIDWLKEIGSVGEEKKTVTQASDETEALRAEVAALQAKLAEKDAAPAQSAPAGATGSTGSGS